MNLRSAFIFSLVISIVASCTKIESTDIGAGLIPPVDNISTFDTSLDIITQNFLDQDSTYPLRSDNLVLGRISNDPLFGKTTGIVNLELKPQSFPFRFTGIYDSLHLDSMVLVLSYKGTWGDTMTTQNLRVYEISQSEPKKLRSDSVFTTRQQFAHNSTVLGAATVDPKALLVDSLEPNKEAVNKNQIRIPITDAAFKNRLFRDTNLLDSNKAFVQRFAGFAIVPDTTSGTANSLLVVNLADTNTKLAIYYSYRVTTTSKRDATVAYWRFGSTSGFSNNIIRNTVGAQYVSTIDGITDSVAYLQTKPDAPYTKLKIPGLSTLPNSVIHRAELVVVQMPDPGPPNLDKLFTPPALFLTAFSADSSRRFMIPGGDVQFSINGVANLADFGSYPFQRTVNNQAGVVNYAFDLTRFVQNMVTRKTRNYDLALFAPFSDYIHASETFGTVVPIATNNNVVNPIALGRVRVGGGSLNKQGPNAAYRMRLRIIYTRI